VSMTASAPVCSLSFRTIYLVSCTFIHAAAAAELFFYYSTSRRRRSFKPHRLIYRTSQVQNGGDDSAGNIVF